MTSSHNQFPTETNDTTNEKEPLLSKKSKETIKAEKMAEEARIKAQEAEKKLQEAYLKDEKQHLKDEEKRLKEQEKEREKQLEKKSKEEARLAKKLEKQSREEEKRQRKQEAAALKKPTPALNKQQPVIESVLPDHPLVKEIEAKLADVLLNIRHQTLPLPSELQAELLNERYRISKAMLEVSNIPEVMQEEALAKIKENALALEQRVNSERLLIAAVKTVDIAESVEALRADLEEHVADTVEQVGPLSINADKFAHTEKPKGRSLFGLFACCLPCGSTSVDDDSTNEYRPIGKESPRMTRN